jgi:hypothetical protein
MPCLLKKPDADSPGVMTFTHNEVLWGIIARSARVREFLNRSHREGKWIFGVHIQGDCSKSGPWPYKDWQSFVMWPDAKAEFLKTVPSEKIFAGNCVSFCPESIVSSSNEKFFDICIVSRPAKIKRIYESLLYLKALMKMDRPIKAVVIVPDHRKFDDGVATYKREGLDRRFFETPRKIFTTEELGNISFLCTPEENFGIYTIHQKIINDLVQQSRFVLLTSHLEGTPRIITEAFLLGTPCIVSENLSTGLAFAFDESNTLKISDEIETGAKQIQKALIESKHVVDRAHMHELFSESINLPKFKTFLNKLLDTNRGEWLLDNLYVRLPERDKLGNYQILYREELFFNFMKLVEEPDPYRSEVFKKYWNIKDQLYLKEKLRPSEIRNWARAKVGRYAFAKKLKRLLNFRKKSPPVAIGES